MRVRVSAADFSKQKADLAACFVYEQDKRPRGISDSGLSRELAAQIKADGFRGRAGDLLIWSTDGRNAARRYLIIGLGEECDEPGEAIRLGAARASRQARRLSARSLALQLPDAAKGQTAVEARAAVEGALWGAYEFDRHLTDPNRRGARLDSIRITSGNGTAAVKRAVALGENVARAVSLARDLVNEAPSRMTPTVLARTATREAGKYGLQCKVWGPAELRKLGMSALLSVSRGSDEPPRVVHLSYKPRGKRPNRKIVLVGKGVTFDSGGLNLKPGPSMLAMKSDMAGAAAVLGVMTALRDSQCGCEVHALLGLVENMTGGDSYKPGDILDTYAGKTVEVGNTDAEGRLVMCDLLAYAAKKLRPTQMIDVATLTGACVVALGTLATGVFSRDETLRESLLAASRTAGEKFWPLPMYDEYLQLLKKGPADLRNIGGRWGGAITAALFLGEFVPRDLSWAHLDIAGPAFSEDNELTMAGASGAAVPTLLRWLETC